ncbi:MAG: hypothetical protein JNM00_05740, partial [Flavobacteriales bacterium]|nr:hypothetical protein [Flavobacteriales bacterium]
MRSAFIPFLFLWSLSMAATGQEGLRDSLLRVIASSKSDTVVINAYITLTEDAADSIT